MLSIKPISQRNNRCKNEKLGFGVGTIGSYGCLLVSYTMLLNYFGIEKTPIEVNEEMKKAGGYFGATKNLWVWAVADKIYKTKYEGSFGWNNSNVLEWINKDGPVIVKVDGKPIGGLSHYVLAIGGGKIADPFTGKIENFSKYKPLGYHVYTYKEGFVSSDLKECLKQHKKLVEEAGEKDKAISSQEKKVLELGKEIKTLIYKEKTAGDRLLKAEGNIKQLKKDNEQIEKKIKQTREFLKPYLYFNLSGAKLVKLGLLKILGSNIQPKGVNKDGKKLPSVG